MDKQGNKSKAGRKPVNDKKMPLTIYVEESVITNLGGGWLITGKDIARSVATNAIYTHYENSKHTQQEK